MTKLFTLLTIIGISFNSWAEYNFVRASDYKNIDSTDTSGKHEKLLKATAALDEQIEEVRMKLKFSQRNKDREIVLNEGLKAKLRFQQEYFKSPRKRTEFVKANAFEPGLSSWLKAADRLRKSGRLTNLFKADQLGQTSSALQMSNKRIDEANEEIKNFESQISALDREKAEITANLNRKNTELPELEDI